MAQPVMKCPHCGKPVELSEAFAKDIELRLQQDHQQQLKTLEERFHRDLEQREQETEKRFRDERSGITEKARRQAEENLALQMKALREELDQKAARLREAETEELALRKRQRDLEEKEKSLELELTRKLDEQRGQLQERISLEMEERFRLKDSEKDRQLDTMRRQIDELKRKAEQGSQQAQGEVLELEIEEKLREEFRFDVIEPVGKGMRGADIVQTVMTQSGRECGKILWETKRTKNWSDGWIPKLKDDQREAKASLAVLISESLPPGLRHFREINGVWVTDISSAMSLAIALRVILIQVANARRAEAGKGEKMEEVYHYLTGPEFRNRVSAIVEAFSQMKQDLDAERRAMQKIWAKREKQIQRVIDNTVCFHGDLEAIAGNALPAISVLELSPEEAEADA